MDFKGQKKFDYNDINNFLPDNFTTGTAEYYQNKFGDKFPEHYYKLMEILTRPEYDDPEEVIRIVEQVRTDAKLENEKIINEWNERQLQLEYNESSENLDDTKEADDADLNRPGNHYVLDDFVVSDDVIE
jgi:hypothetical protein